MIDKLFDKQDEKTLVLNYMDLLAKTNKDFVDKVMELLPPYSPISKLKFAGDRKTKFVYFNSDGLWYSFIWNKQAHELMFNVQPPRQPWKMVIGYRVV